MKLIKLLSAVCIIVLFISCEKKESVTALFSKSNHTLTFTTTVPDGQSSASRTTAEIGLVEGERNIIVKWKSGDKIRLYFKQGNTLKSGGEVTISNISTDGKRCNFTVDIPTGIQPDQSYTVIGTHGLDAATITEGTTPSLKVDISPRTGVLPNLDVPIYFTADVVANATPPANVSFQHLGSLQLVVLSNTSSSDLSAYNSRLMTLSSEMPYMHYHAGKTTLLDLLDSNATPEEGTDVSPTLSPHTIPANSSATLYTWFVPTSAIPAQMSLFLAYDNGGTLTSYLSNNTKPARTTALQKGHSYILTGIWNGAVFRIRPKMAIEYVAEYNVAANGTGFATSHSKDASGYFKWNDAKTNFTNITIGGTLYHLPSKAEWFGIIPEGGVVTFQSNNDNTPLETTGHSETIVVNGTSKTYTADYKSNNGGICYALRFKDNNNTMLCAYRYERVYNSSGDLQIKVTVRYLGASFIETIATIAKETYWNSNNSSDVVRIFPACGCLTVPYWYTYSVGSKCYYWSDDSVDGSYEAYFMSAFDRYANVWRIDKENKLTIRLFYNN